MLCRGKERAEKFATVRPKRELSCARLNGSFDNMNTREKDGSGMMKTSYTVWKVGLA